MDVVERKIIGFDMDGVLIDHTAAKISFAKEYGFTLLPQETPSEVIKTIMPETVLRDLQRRLYDDPQSALKSPLMPGTREAFVRIESATVPYVLISRRKNPEIAIRLLETHGLWPYYFNEENAFFVPDIESKNREASVLKVTHYVDDELKVIERLIDVRHKFLFDHWGVFNAHEAYIRVKSWHELLPHLL